MNLLSPLAVLSLVLLAVQATQSSVDKINAVIATQERTIIETPWPLLAADAEPSFNEHATRYEAIIQAHQTLELLAKSLVSASRDLFNDPKVIDNSAPM